MKPVIRYALAALLLLASSFTHAATFWAFVDYSYPSSSPASSCSAKITNFSTRVIEKTDGSGSFRCEYFASSWRWSGDVILVDDVCPVELPFEHPDGTCQSVEAPEPETCEKGSDSFSSWLTLGQLDTGDYWTIPKNGCAYEMTSTDDCWELTTGEKGCNVTFTQSEIPTSDMPDGGSNLPTDSEAVPAKEESEGEKDTTETTSETTITTEPTITNPDGSTVDSTTKTTTKVDGSGTTITTGDNTITITDSDGTVTTYSENKTTVTHPDGSVTETISKDTAVKTPNKESTVVTKQPPSTVTNNVSGDTITYNESTTNHYDSSGNLTSSETESSGDSNHDGDEGDSDEEGNCGAPGQPVCEVVLKDTSSDFSAESEKVSQSVSELDAARQKVLDELNDTDEDYGLSAIDGFSVDAIVSRFLPLPTSVSCNGINTSFSVSSGSYGFNFEPCDQLEPLREVLAWVFFILTVFAVVNIMLGRKLF